MIQKDNLLGIYVVNDVAHLAHARDLTGGAVFHVAVEDRGSVLWVYLTANEGRGKRYRLILSRDWSTSIPAQVELALMDIECAPTWVWGLASDRSYRCEFAHVTNPECLDDSGADRF